MTKNNVELFEPKKKGKPSPDETMDIPEGVGGGPKIDARCGTFLRNDIGNAERLIARYGNDLMFVLGGGWYVWDKCRWARDEEAPTRVFDAPDVWVQFYEYDVMPGGEQFILQVKSPDSALTEVHVVLNFFEELRQRSEN